MKYYEYQAITAEEHAFRLILLHPASEPRVEIDIIHASLDEENLITYEAVSYVWGTPERGTSVYVPESQSHLNVTNSLELVLRDLRLPDAKRCLWIDGICINQDDQNDQESREKTHQVRLMDKIYGSANRVLFHLGRPTSLTPILRDTIGQLQKYQDLPNQLRRKVHDVIQTLEQNQQQSDKQKGLSERINLSVDQKPQGLQVPPYEIHWTQTQGEPQQVERPELVNGESVSSQWEEIFDVLADNYTGYHARIRQSVETALERPWFRRVWIIQEVANAREALIYWGPTELSVRWFVDLVHCLNIKTDMHQRAILDMMPTSRRSTLALSSGRDLYDLLVQFIGAQASKQHDKIYALLGMCKNGKGQGTLAIDYSRSIYHVVRDAIAYMSFCDKEDVPPELCTIYHLTERIGSLFDDLVNNFIAMGKADSLLSILSNRGEKIVITPAMIETASSRFSMAIIVILRSHRPEPMTVSPKSLERATLKGAYDVAELLLTQCEEILPFMAKWTRFAILQQQSRDKGILFRRTPLWYALEEGDIKDVRHLLEEGASVDAPGEDYLTPLAWAVTRENVEVISVLLEHHAKITFRRCSAWLMAAEEGKENAIRTFLDHGADIEAHDDRNQTALALAVQHGRENVVKLLLDHGADYEKKDIHGRTPLSKAASGGFYDVLSLRNSSSRCQVVRDQSEQPIREFDGRADDTEWFICKGQLVNHSGESFLEGTNGSVIAAAPRISSVYATLVQVLLNKGADTNSVDEANRGPLWWAVNHGHQQAVEKLLKKGFNGGVYAGDTSLLTWAIWNGYHSIVTQLLADDNLAASLIDDSLKWAVRSDNQFLLFRLLELCAVHDASSYLSTSRISLAAQEDDPAVMRLLAQYVAKFRGDDQTA